VSHCPESRACRPLPADAHDTAATAGTATHSAPTPRELVFALRVGASALQPWDYQAMEANEYDLLLHLQGLFRSKSDAPATSLRGAGPG
jgi:hypothetical protein